MKCKLLYRSLLTLAIFFYCQCDIYAFQEDTAYTKVITQRAAKIVNSLGLHQADKESRLTGIIANQYRSLKVIHDAQKQQTEEEKDAALKAQHAVYLAQLEKELSGPEIEKIKDGMTYSILPVTFTAYQDMIPSLSTVQKQQIYTWLVEAREKAMDAESSEKKHWWFGKYKGRINNYLSSAGIDMKKEEAAWQQRIRDKKAASAKN